MQPIPFESYPFMLSTVTDTATPCQQIPIYYIHSLERPFCRIPGCACHRKSREIAKLLGFISEGILTLREAADLIEQDQKEGNA